MFSWIKNRLQGKNQPKSVEKPVKRKDGYSSISDDIDCGVDDTSYDNADYVDTVSAPIVGYVVLQEQLSQSGVEPSRSVDVLPSTPSTESTFYNTDYSANTSSSYSNSSYDSSSSSSYSSSSYDSSSSSSYDSSSSSSSCDSF